MESFFEILAKPVVSDNYWNKYQVGLSIWQGCDSLFDTYGIKNPKGFLNSLGF
jgi:hypothetical protein